MPCDVLNPNRQDTLVWFYRSQDTRPFRINASRNAPAILNLTVSFYDPADDRLFIIFSNFCKPMLAWQKSCTYKTVKEADKVQTGTTLVVIYPIQGIICIVGPSYLPRTVGMVYTPRIFCFRTALNGLL